MKTNFLIPIDLNLIQPNGNLHNAVIAEMDRRTLMG
jgi:hypothetical protein